MNQPTKPRVFSDKIKKYRRIDYEKEQQEKQAEAKKARRVQFCLKNTRVQMFDIAEGNTLGRSTSQEGVINVYAPTSTLFLRGALGTPTNPQPAGFRHRQLTAQIQKDITSLTEIVKQRTKAVVDQSNREGYGERIGLLERVVRHTRLFVTDSLLANIDDSQFRNMLFFRLDNQKNMNMLLDGLQSQSQYIIKEVNAFEFSYIFLLYGFDLIEHGERAPSVDYVSKLHNFFKTLANLELRRDEKEREYDATYQYLVPQLVLITIPEIGNHIERIKEFNQQIRNFVQAKKASHSHNFHLIDWAEVVAERKSAGTETEVDDNEAVRILVKELLAEYGVLCM